MDEIEKLRTDLVLAGWRIERNSLNDRMNLVDWYAWQPKRPADWPNCQCNDKPPSVCIYPYAVNLPQQEKTFANVEVEVCGELAGRWYKLRSYSITAGEAMDALPHITASLGAAWKAIAEMDAPAPQSAQPLTDEQINTGRQALPYDIEDKPEPWSFKEGVRFAERMHGIGE